MVIKEDGRMSEARCPHRHPCCSRTLGGLAAHRFSLAGTLRVSHTLLVKLLRELLQEYHTADSTVFLESFTESVTQLRTHLHAGAHLSQLSELAHGT